ncbi:hypothetical protein JCM4814A_32640 [Streptomyces phaeofaciens JCM 4814]|uniref:Uncharacterized protein n=1 Tax=Streptomyces phaeofaciens TaxID=68254 RepID=A0A918LZ16_9ACTN|nr:hypothetical protein GCM10010226_59760 [Streptomyces phaeofaciens]
MAEAADVDVDNEAADDGANPRVTILPSATAHSGRGGFGGSARHSRALPDYGRDPYGERNPILPVELGCGNEQLRPPTVIWRSKSYIPTR